MTRTVSEHTSGPPTANVAPATLAKASAAALTVAAAVTVLFVLPAEAGIDPTGVGTAIGLSAMSDAGSEDGTEAVAAVPVAAPGDIATPSRISMQSTTAFREDEQTIELAPHSGIEVKAHMKKGDGYTFDWQATGPLLVDMHGEPPNAGKDEFTSYWTERETTSQTGTFVAPIEGSHGWYWRNKGDTPVTINLKVSGFYEDLYRP